MMQLERLLGLEVVEFATAAPTLMKGEFSENVGSDVDSHMIRQSLGACVGITIQFSCHGPNVDVSCCYCH